MTSVLKDDDKIFTMYRQYRVLLYEENVLERNGASQIAAHLTIAHMLDHVVCLLKGDEPPTATKVNDVWRKQPYNEPVSN